MSTRAAALFTTVNFHRAATGMYWLDTLDDVGIERTENGF